MGLRDVKEAFLGVGQKKLKPKEFLEQYRALVKEYVHYRDRLKNPISLKGGGPLAQSSMNLPAASGRGIKTD